MCRVQTDTNANDRDKPHISHRGKRICSCSSAVSALTFLSFITKRTISISPLYVLMWSDTEPTKCPVKYGKTLRDDSHASA